MRLWDVATGAALGRVGDGSSADDVAFSPTGCSLPSFAPRGEEEAQRSGTWPPLADRRRSRSTPVPSTRSTATPSPSVRTAACSRPLATTRSYTSGTSARGKLIRELEQNVGGVLTLEFSPDGTTLAISGFDPVASLLDVATGTQIGPRLTAGSRGAMLDLSPDGRRLLMTNGNGEGAVWNIDPDSWARRACALANRTLTREEWEEFLPGRPYEPACAS